MGTDHLLSLFKEITRIPRESGHEEQIIAYLQKFAEDRNLECKTDEVIIDIPYQNRCQTY